MCPADAADFVCLSVHILANPWGDAVAFIFRRCSARGVVADGWRGGEWPVRVGVQISVNLRWSAVGVCNMGFGYPKATVAQCACSWRLELGAWPKRRARLPFQELLRFPLGGTGSHRQHFFCFFEFEISGALRALLILPTLLVLVFKS